MSDAMKATVPRSGRRRRLSILTVMTLLAGCLVSVVVTALTGIPAARADTVPPPPPGWTTVFGDNFAGASGSAPSSANWFYDIGTGYGTGRQRSPSAEGHQQRRDMDVRADREHAGRLPGSAGRRT
jgi:hypothetical protein